MSLLRHEVTVQASFSCPRLVFGWLGFVSRLFFCSGFGLWFSGVGEKPWESLEELAWWTCLGIRADSGLFSGIWLWNMPGPVRNAGGGGWSPVESSEECEVVRKGSGQQEPSLCPFQL